MYRIYGVLNPTSMKYYIGKTKNSLAKRKHQHELAANRKTKPHKFYDCLLKEGSLLIWFIIEDNIDDGLINDREKFYISTFNSFENGYNGTPGGDGGNTWGGDTDESRRELARIRMLGENNPNYGKKMSEETKSKMINSKTGQAIHTDEYKKILSERLKNEWANGNREYILGNYCKSWLGKELSETHKLNIGNGVKNSSKYRDGIKKAAKTKHNKYLLKLEQFRECYENKLSKYQIMDLMKIKEPTYYKYLSKIRDEKKNNT